jgi:two-component system, NarL family, nitrate/nitrite response regulator NarL
MTKTVLVVDDHLAFRASARTLLELEGFEVVGEATDAAAGIEAAHRLRPDVVLLDVRLPDLDGVSASKRIGAENGGTAIVLTSSGDIADLASELPHCPARGFIPKSELSGDALRALVC